MFFLLFLIRLESNILIMIQNTAFTPDFYFTSFSQQTITWTSLSRLGAFPGCMQPAIWAMYVVMKLDARGAVMLNELTTVLLSGTFSWRPLVLLSPEAGLWIMHVRAQAHSGLRHIHRSCYLSWHILSESQVNMSPAGLCYTRLKPPQTDSGFKSRAEQRK